MSKVIFLFICVVTSLCVMSTTTVLDEKISCGIRVVLHEEPPKNRVQLPSDITEVKCHRNENEGYLFASHIYKFNSVRSEVELENVVDGEWTCHLSTQNSPGEDIGCTVHVEYRDTGTDVAVTAEVILNLEKLIDEDLLTIPDPTYMAPPVTTQRIIEEDPSTTDATDLAPVTTEQIIEEDPSTTDATDLAPVTTEQIIEEDPSTTPGATDIPPVTTLSPSNYVSLVNSSEQLAINTEANQVKDTLNQWEWMVIGGVATGLMFICIINVIVLIYCVKQRQRKAKECPPMRLPSDIVYDYVYSHRIMNRNNGNNIRKA